VDEKLKAFLEQNVAVCNQPSFIAPDPISVPHRFTQKQDIEIAAFFASIFAWGNRTTIINKTNALLQLWTMLPTSFVLRMTKQD
jgi:hypothetical protein